MLATGGVVRVDPGGPASAAADDVTVPNGMVVSEDGSTLVVGETLASRYTAFTIGADGGLSERRLWAELKGRDGGAVAPDGCGMDAEGCIWFADSFAARFVLVREGGEVVEDVPCPEGLNAYACMLGGPTGARS